MSSRRAELMLLLGSVLIFLAAAEITVRLFGLADPRPSGYAPVNTRRRGMAPTNALGYRDLERAPAKPPGVKRILSLGDSFAWGAGIEFDDTYARRLERHLERRRGEDFEVVQLALPGMTTVDQASQLVQEGLAYGPDLVLLGYVLNDSEEPEAAEARRAREWEEEREEKRQPSRLDRSALFRLVSTRIWATTENRRRIAGYRSMYRPEASGWQAAQKALKLMGGLCTERGIPFVVAIFPLFGQPLDASYPFAEIHAQVAQAAAAGGARVVDLLPAYRGLRFELLVVDGAADEHPNEIAHRIAAGVILKAIEDVLPPPPPRGSAP
jgi:hypothetical protein